MVTPLWETAWEWGQNELEETDFSGILEYRYIWSQDDLGKKKKQRVPECSD